MLLAELEVFQSRPIAPTRRVALGTTVLPVSPTPGFGGLLLGAVVAAFITSIDADLTDDLLRLTHQLEAGHRVPQPRLRHRLQEDRVGLTAYRHRLISSGDELTFDIDEKGGAEPNVLGAVYAASRIGPEHRAGVFAAVRRGVRWRGDIDKTLVDYLSDARATRSWSTLGGLDPLVWALGVFDLTPASMGRPDVQRRFRELLRTAHPDHGGAVDHAARRIDELTEARRILLGGPG
ncbi:MAG: hypothetical protein ABIP03_02920 [Aquihabitans sp.]